MHQQIEKMACLPFTTLLDKGSSEKGLSRHLSNNFFSRPSFPNNISYEGNLLFENVQNLI